MPRFERPEDDVDLRHESEVFQDHERLDSDEDKIDAMLKSERDQLAEESDGIIRLSIPAYEYDTAYNPFLATGPKAIRIYSISRHVDLVFLHRFMFANILVSPMRSGMYVSPDKRAKFAQYLRDTGGLPIEVQSTKDYDFTALRFEPYVRSDTTMTVFEYYHKSDAHAGDRPHYPLDIWAVYDLAAYNELGKGKFRLKPDYDRKASLLAVAVIN